MKRLNSYKQNVLLLKDDVGRPKPSTRRLPGNQFIFGKPEVRDPEDAGKGKLSLKSNNYAVQLPLSGTTRGRAI